MKKIIQKNIIEHKKNSKASFLKIKNELPHLVKGQKGRRKRKYLICSILIDKMTDISRSFSIFNSRVLQRNLERIFSVNQTKAKSATMPCHLPQEKAKIYIFSILTISEDWIEILIQER